MIELLRIEWYKVKGYRAFWIFTILYLASIAGINYIGFYLHQLTAQNAPVTEVIMQSPFSFPRVWATAGFMSSWLLYFPGILFIMMLTNEFNFKTHRQNIIDGWERKEFINVKFVFAIIFSLLATVFSASTALIIGLVSKNSVFTFDSFYHVGYIFIQTLSYITFAMFLAVLMRRSGAAIAVFFLYGLIFESLISNFLNLRLNLSPIGYFLPLQVTDTLLPFPFAKQVLYQGAPDDWVLLVASGVYLFLYYFFTRRKFERDDL